MIRSPHGAKRNAGYSPRKASPGLRFAPSGLRLLRLLNSLVDEEVRSLPPDMVARFLRYGDVIEQAGLEALPREAVKHLEGKLWELRIAGRDGISRAIYVTASGRRVVVVRVFIKRTQRTPRRELDIARQRAKEVE